MKVLGYIDDVVSWYFNWHINLPFYWNVPLILLELFIILFIYNKCRTVIM